MRQDDGVLTFDICCEEVFNWQYNFHLACFEGVVQENIFRKLEKITLDRL